MPKLTVTLEWTEHEGIESIDRQALHNDIERVVRGSSDQLADHLYARYLPNGIGKVTATVGDIEA